jgi:light-regulated signal transduction histidine kinase (bacteriophytochrome)/CheY-like chemotaxis protein
MVYSNENKVNLTNCDREPIHIPGGIQPHGAMLVASPEDFCILYASANAGAVTGYPAPIVRGLMLADVIGAQAEHDIRNAAMKVGGGEIAGVELNVALAHGDAPVDLVIHRYKGRVFVEIEPVRDHGKSAKDALDLTQHLVRRIGVETDVGGLARAGARLVRSMLGYDRVMVYRFLHNGAGKVIAESKRHDLRSFMGQHFPAGDIPYQARRLYELNAIRMIGNAAYDPVPLLPALSPGEQPVDMSFAQLRSVSPIHCQYLRNMGVGASLSISIVVDGTLWGLISCHHDSPKVVPIALRIGAELFGQYFSLQISVAERRAHAVASGLARERLGEIFADLSLHETPIEGLRNHLEDFSRLLDCDGVGLWSEHAWSRFGIAPSDEEAKALAQYLGGESEAGRLGLWHAQDLCQRTGLPFFGGAVAGALAIPLTPTRRDYLIFFRSEEAHQIEWAGSPAKETVSAAAGDRLTPRGSFELWREEVRGQSQPWSESDLTIGEAMLAYFRDLFLKQHEATADERAHRDHYRRVLNDELNHRVKNIITLVRSIAVQTGVHAENVADFSRSLEGRLRALAFAHDQSLSSAVGGDLETLIEAEAGLHRYGSEPDRVVAIGTRVRLNDRAFGVLALVVHELMTNAAKYGALSTREGKLRIVWRLTAKGDCEIAWTEMGGPAVSVPSRHGFGSRLIQTTMVYDLGGLAEVEYAPEGVRARLLVPGKHVSAGRDMVSPVPAASGPIARKSLNGLSLLLVEDQSLIALDTEELLRQLGASDVRLSPDATHAILALGSFRPDVAVLDFNLGDTTSEQVADRLSALNVPFVFATGYGDNVMIPERLRHVPVVRKPVSPSALTTQIEKAQQAVNP